MVLYKGALAGHFSLALERAFIENVDSKYLF